MNYVDHVMPIIIAVLFIVCQSNVATSSWEVIMQRDTLYVRLWIYVLSAIHCPVLLLILILRWRLLRSRCRIYCRPKKKHPSPFNITLIWPCRLALKNQWSIFSIQVSGSLFQCLSVLKNLSLQRCPWLIVIVNEWLADTTGIDAALVRPALAPALSRRRQS